MANRILQIFFITAIAICAFLPFFSYSKPALDIETCYEYSAYAVNTIGMANLTRQYYWHVLNLYSSPPLYIWTLSLFCKIFGLNLISLRLTGLIAILIMTFLVYCLSKEIFKKEKERLIFGLLASFIYISIPLIIQSSVYIEVDNATLPIAMIVFVMGYIHFYKELNIKRIILLGSLFALTLWAKLTTPLVLILAVGAFHLLRRDSKESIKRPLLIFLFGATLFVITFSLYCSIINWECFRAIPMVVSVALIKRSQGTFYFKLFTMLKTILRLSLWISPYLIFLWLISLKESFKRIIYRGLTMNSLDFLSIYSCLIFLGYLYFGGSHGFPRYHIPMVFAICVLVVNLLKGVFKDIKTNGVILYIALILFMIGYYVFIVKDMLYLTNYELKVALAFDTSNKKDLFLQIFKQSMLYFLPLPLIFLIIKVIKKEFNLYKVILSSFFILAISSNLGLNILQAKADYVTVECYGTQGQKEVISFLKKHIDLSKKDTIIAHIDINYYLGKRDFPMEPFIELELKYDPKKLLVALKDLRLKALVYNVPQLTLKQMRETIRNKDVQRFLEDKFIEFSFGSYSVWLRKD